MVADDVKEGSIPMRLVNQAKLKSRNTPQSDYTLPRLLCTRNYFLARGRRSCRKAQERSVTHSVSTRQQLKIVLVSYLTHIRGGLASHLLLLNTIPLQYPCRSDDQPLVHGEDDGLVDWLCKVLLQVLSPTPLLRSAGRRFF